MSTEISWVFEAAIMPDALDEYGALAREISADNQAAEPGQQVFEWFVNGQDVHIYERYQDSAAALAHVQRFVENFGSRFLSLCSPTRMSVSAGRPRNRPPRPLSRAQPSTRRSPPPRTARPR